ncbi:hypothetical protein evm_013992 [Chilo suppressalis]|nr:hypothetical protein evm_013992 [Chilo suppressalis]
MHDNGIIDENTQKPEIIMNYNESKGGVDTVDKMCETYNVARGAVVFFYDFFCEPRQFWENYTLHTAHTSFCDVGCKKTLVRVRK